MTTHISGLQAMLSSCFYQLRRIKLIQRKLPTSVAIQLVNSFVISRIDYCNSLMFGLPVYQLHRVQQVLNAAARMIFGGKREDSITPLLVKLHSLSAVEHVRFKICLNAAARMIFGRKREDSITPLLVKLHSLSAVEHVRFKICLTVYKSLGLSPGYLSKFLKPVADLHRRSTLCSAIHDHLLVSMITSEFGKRSFAFVHLKSYNRYYLPTGFIASIFFI